MEMGNLRSMFKDVTKPISNVTSGPDPEPTKPTILAAADIKIIGGGGC